MIAILGLCICYNNYNYGTMLQAYATTVAIEKMGIPYEIIRYKKKLSPLFAMKSLPRLLNPILLHEKKLVLQKKLHLKRNKIFAANSAVKDTAFARFEQAHFHNFSPVYYGYQSLVQQAKKYGACLVGSDQLWSPSGLPTNFYNLKFVADNVPKISYAASFGVSSIPFFQKSRTRDYLMRIEHLSVRENSAKKIILALTGREARVVADPTLLLDAGEWAGRIPVHNPQQEPYCFAYFLGASTGHRKTAVQLAKQAGLKLIALRHMDQFVAADEGFGDEAPYDVGPQEFLNLIRHASYICTDSFHGTVFSVIHHKPFVVFERYNETGVGSRNSRIHSLCENLGLSARRYDPSVPVMDIMTAEINYTVVEEKLTRLRNESIAFLEGALSFVSAEDGKIHADKN